MPEMVARNEDMSPNGLLRLIKQDDGDVIVVVVPDEENSTAFGNSIEFCSCGGGGGKSPRTLKALRELFLAMQEDNKECPWRNPDRD
jgi:hypothetical protein